MCVLAPPYTASPSHERRLTDSRSQTFLFGSNIPSPPDGLDVYEADIDSLEGQDDQYDDDESEEDRYNDSQAHADDVDERAPFRWLNDSGEQISTSPTLRPILSPQGARYVPPVRRDPHLTHSSFRAAPFGDDDGRSIAFAPPSETSPLLRRHPSFLESSPRESPSLLHRGSAGSLKSSASGDKFASSRPPDTRAHISGTSTFGQTVGRFCSALAHAFSHFMR